MKKGSTTDTGEALTDGAEQHAGNQAPLSRREVVGGAVVGTAALALPAGAEAKPKRRRKRAKKPKAPRRADVVVVGAGLAGLVAARDLKRAGKKVVVMEARNRVGGRCFSRAVPGAGDVANLGATFVGPTQTRIVALAKELGIGTFPTYNTGRNVFFFNNSRGEYTGAIPPVSPVALVEAQKAIIQLNDMAQTVPLDAPWNAPQAAEYDGQTFETWKLNNVTAPDSRKLIDLAIQAIFSIEPRDVSLLFVLFYIHSAGNLDQLINTAGGAQESRIEGGAQLIAERLAAKIGKKRVLLKTPVRRIVRRKAGGVDVIGDKVTVRAKRVIVAIPPDYRVPHPLLAGSPGHPRPADPAGADGLGDQDLRRLRHRLLARRRPYRPGDERHRSGAGHVRRIAQERQAWDPAGLRGLRRRPSAQSAPG